MAITQLQFITYRILILVLALCVWDACEVGSADTDAGNPWQCQEPPCNSPGMADRPLLQPEWASDLTQVVQPPEGRKDTGFAPGEEPPAGWINWLWNLNYQWIAFLSQPTWVPVEPWNAAQVTTGTATYDPLFQRWEIDSGSTILMRIPLAPGDSLRAIRVYGRDDTQNRLDVNLFTGTSAGFALVGSAGSSDLSGTLQFVDRDLGEGTEYELPGEDNHALIGITNTSTGGTDPVFAYFARLWITRVTNPTPFAP